MFVTLTQGGTFSGSSFSYWTALGFIAVPVLLLLVAVGVPAVVLWLARLMQHGPVDQGGSDRSEGETQPQSGPARTKQVLAHLSGFCAVMGIPSFFGPFLALLLVKGDQSIAPHAKAALNFHLSAWFYGAAGLVLAFLLTIVDSRVSMIVVLFGGLLLVATVAIATATGAHRAYHGRLWRYPLAIRFVK